MMRVQRGAQLQIPPSGVTTLEWELCTPVTLQVCSTAKTPSIFFKKRKWGVEIRYGHASWLNTHEWL